MTQIGAGRSSYSPVLRVPMASLFRNVLRVFDSSPPDEDSRAKALRRIGDCIDIAGAAWANAADRASVTLLQRLQALLRPPGAAIPARDPDAPPPVWSPAPRAPAPPVTDPAVVAAPPQPAREPPVVDPDSAAALAGRLLARLAELAALRRAAIHEPLTTWAELGAIDQEIERGARSFAWAGTEAADLAERRLAPPASDGGDDALDDDAIFAAVVGLLAAGRADEIFARLARAGDAMSLARRAGAWTALRLAAPAHLSQLGSLSANLARAGVLDPPPGWQDVLADHALITADHLLLHLDSPDDAVAARAAELLAGLGRGAADLEALMVRLASGLPEARRPSFLFAAAVLGAPAALAEVRAAADGGSPASALAIDALVVAGTRGDADRLRRWAEIESPLADLAAAAAGYVEAQLAAGARLTREQVLARLRAPAETLRARRWCALQALALPGARPIAALDAGAPVSVQEALVAELAARLGR